MKAINLTSLVILTVLLFASCEKNDDTDTQKPEVDLTYAQAFPVNCDTLYFGETAELKLRFTDNEELGSFSIEVHNNFDHHSHSTEVSHCQEDEDKDPVNPWVFINDYEIPTGHTEYTASISLSVPSGNSAGNFDEGDYHFYISLTDKTGWSAQVGLSIKVVHRKEAG